MEQYKPLKGVKVVELSLMVASASCGRMMADWGADVIKLENTKGGYIDKHDVDHCLYERISTLTTYMRDFVCPTSIVVVLDDAKLQLEQVGKREMLARRIVHQRLHKVEKMPHSLLVYVITISG